MEVSRGSGERIGAPIARHARGVSTPPGNAASTNSATRSRAVSRRELARPGRGGAREDGTARPIARASVRVGATPSRRLKLRGRGRARRCEVFRGGDDARGAVDRARARESPAAAAPARHSRRAKDDVRGSPPSATARRSDASDGPAARSSLEDAATPAAHRSQFEAARRSAFTGRRSDGERGSARRSSAEVAPSDKSGDENLIDAAAMRRRRLARRRRSTFAVEKARDMRRSSSGSGLRADGATSVAPTAASARGGGEARRVAPFAAAGAAGTAQAASSAGIARPPRSERGQMPACPKACTPARAPMASSSRYSPPHVAARKGGRRQLRRSGRCVGAAAAAAFGRSCRRRRCRGVRRAVDERPLAPVRFDRHVAPRHAAPSRDGECHHVAPSRHAHASRRRCRSAAARADNCQDRRRRRPLPAEALRPWRSACAALLWDGRRVATWTRRQGKRPPRRAATSRQSLHASRSGQSPRRSDRRLQTTPRRRASRRCAAERAQPRRRVDEDAEPAEVGRQRPRGELRRCRAAPPRRRRGGGSGRVRRVRRGLEGWRICASVGDAATVWRSGPPRGGAAADVAASGEAVRFFVEERARA